MFFASYAPLSGQQLMTANYWMVIKDVTAIGLERFSPSWNLDFSELVLFRTFLPKSWTSFPFRVKRIVGFVLIGYWLQWPLQLPVRGLVFASVLSTLSSTDIRNHASSISSSQVISYRTMTSVQARCYLTAMFQWELVDPTWRGCRLPLSYFMAQDIFPFLVWFELKVGSTRTKKVS